MGKSEFILPGELLPVDVMEDIWVVTESAPTISKVLLKIS